MLRRLTHWTSRASIILLETVVFPEALPPQIPGAGENEIWTVLYTDIIVQLDIFLVELFVLFYSLYKLISNIRT